MHASPAVGELKAAELNSRCQEQVSAVRFSSQEELLWSGTESGWVYAHTMPDIKRYSSTRGHKDRVADIVALPPLVGNGALSISTDCVRCHLSGGLSRFAFTDHQGDDLTTCAIDMQQPQHALLGRASGKLNTLDLGSGKLASTVELSAESVDFIRTSGPRGSVAIGFANGQVALTDPRARFKAEQSITPHAGGLVAMDLSGGLLATSGIGLRQGHPVKDTIVKVYDLRNAAKVMATLPFATGPALLRFHPRLTGTLLVAASSGIFSLAQVQGTPYAPITQVETEGDLLTAADFSSSGECLAFGGSGGFVHLWGYNQEPRVNLRCVPLEIPPKRPEPAIALTENDSFAAVPPLYPDEGKPLSEWAPNLLGRRDLRPRVVEVAGLKDVKQVDFVTYISNPHFRRGRPRGEAARLVAALRNRRLQPSRGGQYGLGMEASVAVRQLASSLPQKYAKRLITIDAERRYEEFNFAKYNSTRFSGLENGIANCYANALVQVLYFIPPLRSLLLGTAPDASLEFSLLDELSLLARMLASESGNACQATNLFRALRQSREATGLGLLEGHAQKGAHGADIEVEANKDRSLARRIQGLLRFLLDKLHHEATKRGKVPPPAVAAPAEVGGEAERGGAGGAAVNDSEPSASAIPREDDSGAADLQTSVIEAVFGTRMRQRMQSLQGSKPAIERETRAFQIDLQYPRRGRAGQGPSEGDPPGGRPSFLQVLLASLKAESETRAWFSDELKYQYVRQNRTPLAWPQVMAIGTGLQERANLHWWQPVKVGEPPAGEPAERDWAPMAMALDLNDGKVAAFEAPTAAELLPAEGSSRAVFELTAVVALIDDEEAASGLDKKTLKGDEGHLVAHVRVPASYLSKEVGLMPTPRAPPASPGLTPSKQFWPAQRFQPGPALPENPFEGLPDDPFGSVVGEAQEKAGAAEEHGLPEDPFGSAEDIPVEGPEGEQEAEGKLPEAPTAGEEPDANGVAAAWEASAATDASGEGPSEAASSPDIPEQFAGLKVTARRSSSWRQAGAEKEDLWLLINDFSISTTPKTEVLNLFEGHKVPCLLFYSQVTAADTNKKGPDFHAPHAPVLSKEAFHRLCKDPPLQAAMVGLSRLGKPAFSPLKPEEGPRPGLIFGLDAEFVAFSPPLKALRGGVEIETAPSRLGLARVSVVRAEGPSAGKPCIDDYIRTTEPVYDYLTQYSGLVPGDLDPTTSQHHLTTMKAAYMKLRFLVDSGCVFVGHGLKKDFRMINIVVPQSQVIDTVDLFYLKKQRKLSLRFLAAYLLQADIQQHVHNSIEDARTAISLYKMYLKIEAEGRLREVLLSMYAWGKQHGWDPQALKEHPAANLPSPVKPIPGERRR